MKMTKNTLALALSSSASVHALWSIPGGNHEMIGTAESRSESAMRPVGAMSRDEEEKAARSARKDYVIGKRWIKFIKQWEEKSALMFQPDDTLDSSLVARASDPILAAAASDKVWEAFAEKNVQKRVDASTHPKTLSFHAGDGGARVKFSVWHDRSPLLEIPAVGRGDWTREQLSMGIVRLVFGPPRSISRLGASDEDGNVRSLLSARQLTVKILGIFNEQTRYAIDMWNDNQRLRKLMEDKRYGATNLILATPLGYLCVNFVGALRAWFYLSLRLDDDTISPDAVIIDEPECSMQAKVREVQLLEARQEIGDRHIYEDHEFSCTYRIQLPDKVAGYDSSSDGS